MNKNLSQLIETVHDRTIKILDLASEHRIPPLMFATKYIQTIDGKPNRFKMQLDGLTGVLSHSISQDLIDFLFKSVIIYNT